MSAGADRAIRRAARLLRWYPRTWRARYGEEFTELLIADLTERPRSLARTLDVARGGVLARLTGAGLRYEAIDAPDRLRASLAALGCCLAVFLAFGVGLWSQVTIGWQWSAPDTPSIALAMKVMSAALLALLLLALAAATPIAWSAARTVFTREGRHLRAPLVLLLAGAAVIVLGSRHFARGWPGTGGHPWPGRGLVPADLASVAWAATLSVTSYWAHPTQLGAFPADEIAWMVLAPMAILCVVVGAVKTIRRLRLSPRALRFEARLGGAASVAMLVFLGGAACRVVERDSGPRNLFSSGSIDLLDLIVMSTAAAAALACVRRARELGLAARNR